MHFSDLKVYGKFLSRNKVYTTVSVLGFSISLMFVILLTIYVQQEFSMDNFQKNKDRIYLMSHGEYANFANPIAEEIMGFCPEVESFCRIVYRQPVVKLDEHEIEANVLFADSSFFTIFSYNIIDGDPSTAIKFEGNTLVSQAYALKTWGNENPIGKSFAIDGITHTITGIFEDFPLNTIFKKPDFIANYHAIKGHWGKNILQNKGNSSFHILFLEKEGADLPSKAPVIMDHFIKTDYWLYTQGFATEVDFIPFGELYFNDVESFWLGTKKNSKTLVSIYTGITILILIIAILNYINMTVAQSGFRGKEAAIRKLMGCGRKKLIIQLLTESVFMTLFTSLLGLFLAYIISPYFGDLLKTELDFLILLRPGFLLMAVAFIMLISVISGLIPALLISGFDPLEIVKGEFSRRIKTGYSRILNIFQYSIAIALLICSFFIIKQINFLIDYDLGFDKDYLYILNRGLNQKHKAGLKSKLMEIPGVEGVTFSAGNPITGGNNNSFELDGEALSFTNLKVDSAFLNIYGIKWEPTGITPSENTFLTNKEGYNALKNSDNHSSLIHGIVNDIQIGSLHSNTGLVMITNLREKDHAWGLTVKISSSADPFRTADLIKEAYIDFTGHEVIEGIFSDHQIQEWYEDEQKMSKIIMSFSFLTIVIMIMGVFAMSMYTIKQKEKAIAIRKVNGSTEFEILALLNADTLKNILFAAIFAVPVAYYGISKWLNNFIYKTELSWWVFLISIFIVIIITLISISWLTWRAATANPIKALRNE